MPGILQDRIKELERDNAALRKENARLMDEANRETLKYLRLISAINIGLGNGKKIKVLGKVKS